MDKLILFENDDKNDRVIQCLNKIYMDYKKCKDECNRLKLKVNQLERQLKRCSCNENTPTPPPSSSEGLPLLAIDSSNSKKRKSPASSQQEMEKLSPQPPPAALVSAPPPLQPKLTQQSIDSNIILAPETEYDCFDQFNNAINDSEQFNETISETPEQIAQKKTQSQSKKLLLNNKKCKSSSTSSSSCSSSSSSSGAASSSSSPPPPPLPLSPIKLSSPVQVPPVRSPLIQLSNNEQRKLNSNKQQQIKNTTIPGLLLSPDKYYDDEEFGDCLPKRQKNLNRSLKENTSIMDASTSSASLSSKWISKKSKLHNSNDLNISFIQPILPKKNQIEMQLKLSNDNVGVIGAAGDGTNVKNETLRKTQSNENKRTTKLKQATLSFQKKIDDIRQINDDSNATFCADITQPSFANGGAIGGPRQKTLKYFDNKQQEKQENLFNFSKLKENKLSSNGNGNGSRQEKDITVSSKNMDQEKIKITTISNITANPVSPSIIEINRHDMDTENNSSVIFIEDTQPIFTIENDSDENSRDLIEKMNNQKSKNNQYLGETSPIRKKTEKLKRPGFLCNECSKYYNIMDLTDEEYLKRVNQCSNHRKPQHLKETPEGFWNPFITPVDGAANNRSPSNNEHI